MASTGFSIAMASSTTCNFPTTGTTSFVSAASNNHTPISSFMASSLLSNNRRYSPTMTFSSSSQQQHQHQHQHQHQQQPVSSNEGSRTTTSTPFISMNDSSHHYHHQQQQQQQQQETAMYCHDKNSTITKRCRDGSNSLNAGLSTVSPAVTPQQHILHQQQQQQHIHSPCEYRILSPSTPTHPLTTTTIEASSFTPVNVAANVAVIIPVQEQQQQQVDDNTIQPYASATKRTRCNTYIAPREVGKTFNNQVGSIAAAFHHPTTNFLQQQQQSQQQHPSSHNGVIRPIIRRQLSGSKIESFLSGNSSLGDDNNHESMDVEEVTNRPRSMSF